MGIVISETDQLFHVPYGPLNHDGTPQESFIDCKTHPEWIPTLPACVGWPETQHLLQTINAPHVPLMSLAAFQNAIASDQPESTCALTSMVSLCYAHISDNEKLHLQSLSQMIRDRLSAFMQAISNERQQTLDLEVLLELQPTKFHHVHIDGWSLTVFFVAHGQDYRQARLTWSTGMQGLEQALSHPPGEY